MNCHIARQFDRLRMAYSTSVKPTFMVTGYMSFRPNTYMRLGHRGLEQLARSQMTQKDWETLAAINECRLLTTSQIQRLFFPVTENSSTLASLRACYRALSRLNKNQIIIRSNRRIGGIYGGSNPYAYGLGPIGTRLIGNSVRNHYSERISTLFMEHTIAISEIYTNLKEMANSGQINIVSLQTEPSCWRNFMSGYGAREILKPDLYVRLRDINNTVEYLWFIELDRGTSHPLSIEKKADIYRRYYLSGSESKISRVFPRVLWIAPDESRKNQLVITLQSVNNKVSGLHLVTLFDESIGVITDEISKQAT